MLDFERASDFCHEHEHEHHTDENLQPQKYIRPALKQAGTSSPLVPGPCSMSPSTLRSVINIQKTKSKTGMSKYVPSGFPDNLLLASATHLHQLHPSRVLHLPQGGLHRSEISMTFPL